MMQRIFGWFTHFRMRRLEWLLAIYTVFFGAALMLPPVSMASGSFVWLLAAMPESTWGALYFIVGTLHAMALHVNGRAAWTPFARLAALTLNSQVFLAMALYLTKSNPFGTGVITYGFIAIGFCGTCIAAAAYDCGKEIAIWRGQRNVGN